MLLANISLYVLVLVMLTVVPMIPGMITGRVPRREPRGTVRPGAPAAETTVRTRRGSTR